MTADAKPKSAIELLEEAQVRAHSLRSNHILNTSEENSDELRLIDWGVRNALELLRDDGR